MRKTKMFRTCILLFAISFILLGCQNSLSNDSGNDKKTTDDTKVVYLGDKALWDYPEENMYRLAFSFQNAKYERIAANASVNLSIKNVENETVYSSVKQITSSNFGQWTLYNGTSKYLCTISIPYNQITKGKTSTGNVSFSVILENKDYFDESSLSISGLPTLSSYTINFNHQLSEYSYKNIITTITITEPNNVISDLPADPIKDGYVFSGWFTQKNGLGDKVEKNYPISSDLTVYAYWKEKIASIGDVIPFSGNISVKVEKIFYNRNFNGDKYLYLGNNIPVAKITLTNNNSTSLFVSPLYFSILDQTNQIDYKYYTSSNGRYDETGTSFVDNESKTMLSGTEHTIYITFDATNQLSDGTLFLVSSDSDYPIKVEFNKNEIK